MTQVFYYLRFIENDRIRPKNHLNTVCTLEWNSLYLILLPRRKVFCILSYDSIKTNGLMVYYICTKVFECTSSFKHASDTHNNSNKTNNKDTLSQSNILLNIFLWFYHITRAML